MDTIEEIITKIYMQKLRTGIPYVSENEIKKELLAQAEMEIGLLLEKGRIIETPDTNPYRTFAKVKFDNPETPEKNRKRIMKVEQGDLFG